MKQVTIVWEVTRRYESTVIVDDDFPTTAEALEHHPRYGEGACDDWHGIICRPSTKTELKLDWHSKDRLVLAVKHL